MTSRSFSGEDAQRALAASHDYNPIHFCDESARSIAMDEACVGGVCMSNEFSRLVGSYHFCPRVVMRIIHLENRLPLYYDQVAWFELIVTEVKLRSRVVQMSARVLNANLQECATGYIKVRFPPQ